MKMRVASMDAGEGDGEESVEGEVVRVDVDDGRAMMGKQQIRCYGRGCGIITTESNEDILTLLQFILIAQRAMLEV